MAGFGPCLIPDRFHLANQATLARGVRLSLAAAGQALAWCRLWVSWAQTLSKRVPQSVGQFRRPFGFLPELTGRDTSVRMCDAGCHREFVSGSEA